MKADAATIVIYIFSISKLAPGVAGVNLGIKIGAERFDQLSHDYETEALMVNKFSGKLYSK